MHQKLIRLLALLLCVFCLTAAEHRGIIKFGNLGIPGATITAQQADKVVTTVSDPAGNYVFPDLSPGTWMLEVKMLGFAPLKREVIVPETGPTPPWELMMLPLQEITSVAADQLQVKAVAPPKPEATPAKPKPGDVKTTATNTNSGFQRTNVTAAPARANAPAQVDPPAPEPSTDLARNANDGFLINGSVNNGASSQFSQQAAFGNNRGPKRWQYNGNFGFQLDNSSLDARPYSLTGQDTLRPPYSRFTGLAAIGGPLRLPFVKKTGPNFQLNYQWTRNRTASTATTLMPTAAERSGDFSHTVNPLGQPVQVVDPVTGLPFAGNLIPLTRISPQAAALLKFYPLPNFTSQARYNFQVPLVSGTHQDNLQFRSSRQIGRKNNLQGQLLYTSSRTDTPNLFGFLDTGGSKTTNAAVSLRHNFSNRFYINTGIQFNRTTFSTTPFFANRTNVSAAAGITGNNQEPINWGPPALNFTSGIASLSDNQASRNRTQSTGLSIDGFYSRGGKHNLTYGTNFVRLQNNVLSQQDPRGTFGFTGQTAGSDFAAFLLGTPDTSSIAFGNADKYYRSNQYGAFVSDDFRARTGLTFNIGARWDYNSPITELYNRLVNLDIAGNFVAAAPVLGLSPTGTASGVVYPGSLMKPDKNNFSPRISLAWRPLAASSMVVRASYDVGYDTSVYQTIAGQMAQQAPLSTSLRVQTTPANPLSLANGFQGSPQFSPTTFGVDPNFRVGYAQTWRVIVQRDLPFALQMVATYLGIKGTRGAQEFLPNTYAAGTAASAICTLCPSGFTYMTSNGNSTREGGSIQLRRRLRRGLQADMTYTYAHAIDNSALAGAGMFIAQDWRNLSGERGRSNFDQRHQITAQAQYTTGATSGARFLMEGKQGKFFREWTIGTQLTVGTGLPLTPTYAAAASGSGFSGNLRPNYTGQPIYDGAPGLHLNPKAFAIPAAGTFGNAGRNTITGPSQFSFNATMGRTLRLGDRFSADIRLDATNILNHPTYPNWNTVISSAQYGLPTTANGMRNVQTTLRMRF